MNWMQKLKQIKNLLFLFS